MNVRNKKRTRFLAIAMAASTAASLSLAGAAMAQAPGAPQGAPPQAAPQQALPSQPAGAPAAVPAAPAQAVVAQGAQGVAATGVATTRQTVVEDVTPDAGLALGGIAIGNSSAPLADAGHVIEMLIEQRMFGGLPAPGPPAIFAGFDAFGRPRFVQPQMADLEPISLRTVQEGTPVAGPIYAVTIRNCGDLPAGRFRVSLVAALGSIDPLAPTAIATVPQLAAGESMRVDIQLPLSSMAMRGAAVVQPFDTAIVAIDGFDEMPERNELNNLLALRREAIAPLVAVVTETIETTEVATGGAPAAAPVAGAPATADAIPPSATPSDAGPDEIETPAPPAIDGDALDELDMPAENAEMRDLFR
jgi:hypothetical protein